MAVDSLGRLNTSVTKPIADIHLTGPDLLRLGIDPVETDVVDVVIQDVELRLVHRDGEPVIVERAASAKQKEQWREAKSKPE